MDQPKRPSKIRLIVWISMATLLVGGFVGLTIYKTSRDSRLYAVEKLLPNIRGRSETLSRYVEIEEFGSGMTTKLRKAVELKFETSPKEISSKLMSQLLPEQWYLIEVTSKNVPNKFAIYQKTTDKQDQDQSSAFIFVDSAQKGADGEISRANQGEASIVQIYYTKTESFLDQLLPLVYLDPDSRLDRKPRVKRERPEADIE